MPKKARLSIVARGELNSSDWVNRVTQGGFPSATQ